MKTTINKTTSIRKYFNDDKTVLYALGGLCKDFLAANVLQPHHTIKPNQYITMHGKDAKVTEFDSAEQAKNHWATIIDKIN